MYELLDAVTLETVLDGLTYDEAVEFMDKFPSEFLLRNLDFSSIFG